METRPAQVQKEEAMSGEALAPQNPTTTAFKFASSNHTTERICPIKTRSCSEVIPSTVASQALVKRSKKEPVETITIFNLSDIRQFRTMREAERQAKESKRTRRSFNSLSEEEQLAIALKRSME